MSNTENTFQPANEENKAPNLGIEYESGFTGLLTVTLLSSMYSNCFQTGTTEAAPF